MYYHIPSDDMLSVNISTLNAIHHQSTTKITTSDHPNNFDTLTLSAALELSDKGRVICSACHPYPVLYANKAWSILTKYQQHEISGKTLSLLQGELTDLSAIQVMMHNVQYTGHGEAEVINYRQDGTPFFCSLKIQPLSSSDMYGELKITHLLGTYSIFDIDEKMKDLLKKKKEDEYSWLIQCDIIDEEQNTDTIKSIKRRRRQVYLETE